MRDYLDTVVLLELLGPDGARAALAEVAERLAAAAPSDLARVELRTYRGLQPPWNDWDHLVRCGRRLAPVVAAVALGVQP